MDKMIFMIYKKKLIMAENPDDPNVPKAPKTTDRIKDKFYIIRGGFIRKWDGNRFLCPHHKRIKRCDECIGNKDTKPPIQNSKNDVLNEIEKFRKIALQEVDIKDRIDGQVYRIKGNKIRIWKKDKSVRGGVYKCIHGEAIARCKKCPDGNSHECKEHLGKRKDQCPCAICKAHGNSKLTCKECKQMLEEKIKCHIHNKYNKKDCKECGGSGCCEHGRWRNCETCGDGPNICQLHPNPETGKKSRKSRCIECKGIEVCPHGQTKLKKNCILCTPDSKNFCQECRNVRIDQSNFKPYCFDCYTRKNPDSEITRNWKFKESFIHEELTKEFANDDIKLIRNKAIKGTKIYPDWRIDMNEYTIIIECDEDCHKTYNNDTERTKKIFKKLGKNPLVMLRINPDKNSVGEYCFNIENGKVTPIEKIWNQRKKELISFIRLHINEKPESDITEEYIGYD